jgi:hypothetical protein
LLAAYLMVNRSSLTAAAGDPNRAETLDIEPGLDAGAVVERLRQLNIVRRPSLFIRYLTYRGLDTGIEAGRYEVSGAMSIVELSELLQRARTSRYTLTVPEGCAWSKSPRPSLGSTWDSARGTSSRPSPNPRPTGPTPRPRPRAWKVSSSPTPINWTRACPRRIAEMMVDDLEARLSGRPGRLRRHKRQTPFS